jgi:hypothetical protein
MAKPKKKKLYGGILIIVSRAEEELEQDIVGGIWEQLADAMGQAMCFDEDGSESDVAVVDAAVAIADAVAPETLGDPDLSSLLAALEAALDEA